mgnify:CR=1 FL=1
MSNPRDDLRPSPIRVPGIEDKRDPDRTELVSPPIPKHEVSFWTRVQGFFGRVAEVGTAAVTTTSHVATLMNSRTTIAGGIKSSLAILVMLMTALGVDTATTNGIIAIAPGTGIIPVIGAFLYLLLSATQAYLSDARPDAGVRPLVIAIAKALSGGIGTVLIWKGIDVQTGTIALTAATETWIMIAAIGYFLLSGVQAYFTADIRGESALTTIIGVLKSLAGVVATILLQIGVDVEAGTAVMQAKAAGIGAFILYGLYVAFSFLQALKSQDKPRLAAA